MRHFPTSFFSCLAVQLVIAASCSHKGMSPEPDFCSRDSVLICRSGASPFNSDNAEVFIYDREDEALRLESFYSAQIKNGKLALCSRSGRKRAVVIANMDCSDLQFEHFSSYAALDKVRAELMEEDPSEPVLVGEIDFVDGAADIGCSIVMAPLLCRVEIRFLDIDFGEQCYKDAVFENPRAYLTCLNASFPVCGGNMTCNETLNDGAFDWFTLKNFRHPDMVYSRTAEGAVLYCYPGTDSRLVIEGEIDGNTYYYAMDISQWAYGEKGKMKAGENYVFDILLKRKGTTDPAICADPASIKIKLVRNPWIEKEDYDEEF